MISPEFPENEIDRLTALKRLKLMDTEAEDRFDRLTRITKRLFDVPIVLVSLIDENRQWFKSKQGLDACETGRDISFCGHAILDAAIFEIPDASQDSRFADNPLVTGPPEIRFYAGAPLATSDGYRIGTLCLIDNKARQLDARERSTLRDLADLVEQECLSVISRIEKQKQLDAFILLNQLAADSHLDQQLQIEKALKVGGEYLGLDIGIVSRIQDNDYKVLAVNAPAESGLSAGQSFILGDTYCDLVLKADDLVALHHMGESEHCDHPCYEGVGLEAYIGVALEVDGKRFGTLNFSSALTRSEPFSEIEKLFVRLLARWVSAVIDHDRSARAIKRNESRLRSLFELSPIGIALNDFETGQFIELNQALLAPTGYSLDEFTRLNYLDITPQEYQDKEDEYLESLKSIGRYGPFEKEYIRKDGSRYPVLLNGMIVEEANGKKLIWSMIEDISERKRIERMKNEFISTVSHELRTPLTAISGALGLIKGGVAGELPETLEKMLDVAFDNSQRLNLLVDDLLDMEKLLAGKMRFDLQPYQVQDLLMQAIKTNQSYADQFKVNLCLLECDPEFCIKVDAARFAQVMSNLLSNAAKFSPEASRVELKAVRKDDKVRISVRDFGEGIPAEFQSRIFQKFSQADSSDSRQKGGTGLGLAITRELLEHMQGTIEFKTSASGTEFFFDLMAVSAGSVES